MGGEGFIPPFGLLDGELLLVGEVPLGFGGTGENLDGLAAVVS